MALTAWAAGALLAFAAAGLLQRLKITRYRVILPNMKGTRPVRLLLLADLHGKRWGKGQRFLLNAARAQQPDAVVLAGDMTEAGHSYQPVIELARGLTSIAPVFFVAGNHDLLTFDCDAFTHALEKESVVSLRDQSIPLRVRDETITLSGLDDPFIAFIREWEDTDANYEERLREVSAADGPSPRVLITHRPEYAVLYARAGYHLALCGHTHGGQVRLPPPLRGLYASGQGFFPRYAAGEYRVNGMHMIISRGLHQSVTRPRFFNRPEVVAVDMVKEASS
ncbi:MAG: metallophosphoesterase [Clostridia bacterium]|nr:metallophosphoesterase [Clostridia bacterium]